MIDLILKIWLALLIAIASIEINPYFFPTGLLVYIFISIILDYDFFTHNSAREKK